MIKLNWGYIDEGYTMSITISFGRLRYHFNYDQIKNIECDEKAKEYWGLAEECFSDSDEEGKNKAKEYWIKAYLTDIRCEAGYNLDYFFGDRWRKEKYDLFETDSRFNDREELEPYANDGMIHAQYLMGKNLTEGKNSWRIDKTEAKKWLKKACERYFDDAEYYLWNKYGLGKFYISKYLINDTIFGDKVSLECSSIEVKENAKAKFIFWGKNDTYNILFFRARNICVDGHKVLPQASLGRASAYDYSMSYLYLPDIIPNRNNIISFDVGVYNTKSELVLDLIHVEIHLPGEECSTLTVSCKKIKNSQEEYNEDVKNKNYTRIRTTRYEISGGRITIILAHKPDGALAAFLEDNEWECLNSHKTRWETDFSEDAVYTAKDVVNYFE